MFELAEGAFNTKFNKIFGTFDSMKDKKPKIEQFAKEAFSNLMGGIGYFYGPIRIHKDEAEPGDFSAKNWYYDEPNGLFTGTPSRAKFPRGFLWDEGFHS